MSKYYRARQALRVGTEFISVGEYIEDAGAILDPDSEAIEAIETLPKGVDVRKLEKPKAKKAAAADTSDKALANELQDLKDQVKTLGDYVETLKAEVEALNAMQNSNNKDKDESLAGKNSTDK